MKLRDYTKNYKSSTKWDWRKTA